MTNAAAVEIPQLQPPAAARSKDEKKASSAELEWMTQSSTGTTMNAIGRRRSSAATPVMSAAASTGRIGGHGRSGSVISNIGLELDTPTTSHTTASGVVTGTGAAKSLKETALEWQKYFENHKEHLPAQDPFPAGAHLAGREKVP